MTSFADVVRQTFRAQPLWWCLCLMASIWIIGMFLPVMEIDAAQYASIATDMHVNRSFLQVQFSGQDYLDKPPLLFWLSAFSFDLFGVHNWSYRLPSMLSMILGLWSVFHLAKRLYQREQIALLSTVAYASLQSTFLFMHDIRTDTLLTNLVIFAIWQGIRYLDDRHWRHLTGLAAGIALAMLAKGPIGLMVPLIVLLTHTWWTRQWQVLRQGRTWLIPLIVLIILSPMLYGLYVQYDLHPEKEVLGRTGVSGLYFYFWEQSFGRITGASSWQDETGADYFFTNSLWSLLPWTLVAWAALIRELLRTWKHRSADDRRDWVHPSLAIGILVPLIAFTFSHYKLPHYMFVVTPLQALLIGAWIEPSNASHPAFAWTTRLQYFIIILLMAGIGIVQWIFPASAWHWILLVGFAAISLLVLRRIHWMHRAWGWSLFAIVTLNFWLIIHFYPTLMRYQLTSEAIDYMREEKLELDYTAFLGVSRFGLDFFAKQPVQYTEHWDPAITQFKYVLATDKGLQEMDRNSMHYQILKIFQGFPVSRLNAKFLNPKTRHTQYNFAYLVALNQK